MLTTINRSCLIIIVFKEIILEYTLIYYENRKPQFCFIILKINKIIHKEIVKSVVFFQDNIILE